MRLSVIIPTLNEQDTLQRTLSGLQHWRDDVEIIVVDGGSTDRTRDIAAPLVDHLRVTAPGRARQMNAGAELATGDALLFLHADTLLPSGFLALIRQALADETHLWGRFDLCFEPRNRRLDLVAWMINKRSRVTRICTGDQGIFMLTQVFRDFGGFRNIPLMEDIQFTRRLRYLTPPACLDAKVVTSSRRWIEKGIGRTIVLMWWLRLLYWLGVSPDRLVRLYYPGRSEQT
ncbi:TIGR04283 family arsenosugar biosynthesis glycosyltransferase [Halopseudomonas nanhaiensis]|uniref:TIGR04283 family arsenosugar biosynthesis glycosyltransferase n=1 Tax=Halopseudomonas nanhaiensis TaxID=2830842 RepID=UPI001CBAB81E|nr:TIGR04283 family arsenosugar biosynthesis glycosyltransferase [Halopseudomonas nanhaiensis]UAW99420.1 TIGR04283 family arsenosugar biosynthesis glycosyltransferase [Halopseudomonas nanhaiensis]